MPHVNPHSFRNTLTTPGQQLCQTPEQLKAWSQNFGHEDVLTTLYSYGEVQLHRQGEIIHQLKLPRTNNTQSADDIVRIVYKVMAKQQVQRF